MIFFLLLFIQIAIFGALIFLLRHLLKRHIGTASSRLEVLTQEATNKLIEAKKRMDEANAHYEQVLTKSKEDAERSKQQLVDEGFKVKQEMLDQAHKQSEEIMHRAKMAAEAITEELEEKIKQEAIKLTYALVKQVLSGKMSEETHAYWMVEILKGGFDGLAHLNISGDVKEAELVSTFPLKSAEKALLLEQLKKKVGKSIQIKEKVDPELILGFRLTVGSVVIDGTLKNRIEEALINAQSGTSRRAA